MRASKTCFNQARKYKIGLIIAHQNLDQFDQTLQATVMASTSTKLVGGLSAKDAATFARERHCEPEFLQEMHKHQDHTEFTCFVRNYTPQPIQLTVPFGEMECRPKSAPPSLPRFWRAIANATGPLVLSSCGQRISRPAQGQRDLALAHMTCSRRRS